MDSPKVLVINPVKVGWPAEEDGVVLLYAEGKPAIALNDGLTVGQLRELAWALLLLQADLSQEPKAESVAAVLRRLKG
jgi:hypothetical protein